MRLRPGVERATLVTARAQGGGDAATTGRAGALSGVRPAARRDDKEAARRINVGKSEAIVMKAGVKDVKNVRDGKTEWWGGAREPRGKGLIVGRMPRTRLANFRKRTR